MRKVCLLTLVGVLLAGCAAFAVTNYTNYTETFYPGFEGSNVDNWFSVRGVPIGKEVGGSFVGMNPVGDPLTIFGADVFWHIDGGKITRLDPTTNNIIGWYDDTTGHDTNFGNLLLGEGYMVTVDDGTGYSINYAGIPDGVPDAGGVKTDMWISLPWNDGGAGMVWVGMPFNHEVDITHDFTYPMGDPNYLLNTDKVWVTDGTQTVTLYDATFMLGWLMQGWSSQDNVTGNIRTINVDGSGDETSLLPGRMYQVVTQVTDPVNNPTPNYALIIKP